MASQTVEVFLLNVNHKKGMILASKKKKIDTTSDEHF